MWERLHTSVDVFFQKTTEETRMVPKFYQNIRLFPDEETGSKEIGEKLYQYLHIAFVENADSENNSRYAVSFPEYSKVGKSFGRYFRVFAETEKDLINLKLDRICDKLSGYAECTEIAAVPVEKVCGYVRFSRVHQQSSSALKIRRAMHRRNVSVEEAKEAYKRYKPAKIELPVFNLQSCSTNQVFPFYINCKCHADSKNGAFNLYGLSINGNVPDF